MYSNNFSCAEVLLQTVPENQGKLEALTNILSFLFRVITFFKINFSRACYLYKQKVLVVLTFDHVFFRKIIFLRIRCTMQFHFY